MIDVSSIPVWERSILAASILAPAEALTVGLDEAHFSTAETRRLWRAILEHRDVADDPVLIAQYAAVDPVWLCSLGEDVSHLPAHIPHYAEHVRQSGIRRQIGAAVDRISALLSSDVEAGEVLERGLGELGKVRLDSTPAGRTFRDGTESTLAWLQATLDRSAAGTTSGIPTGLRDLDSRLNGLPRGVVTVVAARPSVGKSSLVVQAACYAALQGLRVDLYSLEDTETAIHRRILSSLVPVRSTSLLTGQMDAEEYAAVCKKAIDLASGPLGENLFICDSLPPRASQIVSTMRRNALVRRTDMIVLDYLQLCREPGGRKESRADELGAISQSLKAVAKETNAAMVVVSQLNRGLEGKPELHNLRDSGAIEQDAHVVVLLSRVNAEDSEGKIPLVLADVAKSKDTATGAVYLAWDGRHYRFSTATQELTARLARAEEERRCAF